MYKTSFELIGTEKLLKQATYDIIRYCSHKGFCVEPEFVGENHVLFKLSCEDYKKEKANSMIRQIQRFCDDPKNFSDNPYDPPSYPPSNPPSDCGRILIFWAVVIAVVLIIRYVITH